MAEISAQRLAELVPCSLDEVGRLARLGLLRPAGEDGGYSSSDVHLVRLMAAFEAAGTALEDVARGVREGELSFPLGLFLPEPVEIAGTYEQLAGRLGRSPDLVRRLSGELGLPPRAGDGVRADDAELLTLLLSNLDLADEAELSRFARLYGASVQRLVTAGLEFFDRTVRERVGGFELPNEQKDRLIYERAALFTQLVQALVPWLQRRHREYGVLDYLVGVTERYMQERGITPKQPPQPPAIAFLDLTGYTALADERGDAAAAELAAELAGVVQTAALARGCRPVKWLGDGVMFHFSDPGTAIRTGLDLVEQTEQAIALPARIGINAGPVIVQEGDLFGRTVNVAARIADYARPREVLVSEEAKRDAGAADVEFELVGDVSLKGIATPVRVHKATRP